MRRLALVAAALAGLGLGATAAPAMAGTRISVHDSEFGRILWGPERQAVYAEIQKYVMDNALILPIWDNAWITLTAPGVQGMRFDLEGRPLLYNVWVE